MRAIEGTDTYLSMRQLAQYAGLSVRTLRAHLTNASHPLPHYRMAGKILVKRSEFDAWMIQYRCATPPQVDAIVKNVLEGL